MTARRYGKWPHELLELEPWQEGLAVLCTIRAAIQTAANIEQAKLVFPTVSMEI